MTFAYGFHDGAADRKAASEEIQVRRAFRWIAGGVLFTLLVIFVRTLLPIYAAWLWLRDRLRRRPPAP